MSCVIKQSSKCNKISFHLSSSKAAPEKEGSIAETYVSVSLASTSIILLSDLVKLRAHLPSAVINIVFALSSKVICSHQLALKNQ